MGCPVLFIVHVEGQDRYVICKAHILWLLDELTCSGIDDGVLVRYRHQLPVRAATALAFGDFDVGAITILW